jgi:hypothetical protein
MKKLDHTYYIIFFKKIKGRLYQSMQVTHAPVNQSASQLGLYMLRFGNQTNMFAPTHFCLGSARWTNHTHSYMLRIGKVVSIGDK